MSAIFKLSVVKRGLKRGNDIVPILQIAAIPAKKKGNEIVGPATSFFSRKSMFANRLAPRWFQRSTFLATPREISSFEKRKIPERIAELFGAANGKRTEQRGEIRRFVEVRAKETRDPAMSFIRRLPRTFFVQQNVIGFYVAMYDFVTLQIIEGQSYLGNEEHYAFLGEDDLLLDVIPEIAAKQ